jgi:hypothetical protein
LKYHFYDALVPSPSGEGQGELLTGAMPSPSPSFSLDYSLFPHFLILEPEFQILESLGLCFYRVPAGLSHHALAVDLYWLIKAHRSRNAHGSICAVIGFPTKTQLLMRCAIGTGSLD